MASTSERHGEILRLLSHSRMSYSRIGARFGISPQAIQQLNKAMGSPRSVHRDFIEWHCGECDALTKPQDGRSRGMCESCYGQARRRGKTR